jgi:uncharacterized protein
VKSVPRWWAWNTATIVVGVAMVVVAGLHGSTQWRLVRAALVVVITLVGLWLEHRPNRAVRGTTALILGIVGGTAGAGIGFMHVVKSEADVTAIAGLVALGAGLSLLVCGSALLLQTLHGWWKLLSLPIAFVVFQFVLLPISVGIYASNVPATSLGSTTPASSDLPSTTVHFSASDGTPLSGWYVPSLNGGAVVVVPGAGSNRVSVIAQGAVLAQHGYGVLLMDNRGHGASGGSAMDFGWWGERDLSGAVTYLESRPDVHDGRVAILGESMGGEEAIGAIGRDPRVRAVIAEGVTGRTFADTARLGSGLASLISRADSWISYSTAGLLSRAPQPEPLGTSLRQSAPRPVLIIAGQDEIHSARLLKSTSPSNVVTWEMPDTAHTAGLSTHPLQWQQHVLQFLAAHL